MNLLDYFFKTDLEKRDSEQNATWPSERPNFSRTESVDDKGPREWRDRPERNDSEEENEIETQVTLGRKKD